MSDPTPSAPNPSNLPTTNPVVAPGAVVTVQAKNPLQSTALWGIVVMLVTAGVKKWVPPLFQSEAVNTALEIVGWAVGAALAAYGRWTANRPLGSSAVLTQVVVK